jgi:hypothetical protein
MMSDEAFLAEIEAVCRKHGVVIAHEDRHGAFVLDPLTDEGLAWLMAAEFDSRTEESEEDDGDLSDLIAMIEPSDTPILKVLRRNG